jgi:hypothetical protein
LQSFAIQPIPHSKIDRSDSACMDTWEFLVTIANLSLALIAFITIVVALRQMTGGGLSEFQLLVVKMFSVCGFSAMFFSLLPILLNYFGVPETWLWRFSNASLAAAIVTIHTWYFRRRKQIAPGRKFNLTNQINRAIMVIAVILLLVGTAGIFLATSIAPYAFGLVGLLFASASGFLRTLPDFIVVSESDNS